MVTRAIPMLADAYAVFTWGALRDRILKATETDARSLESIQAEHRTASAWRRAPDGSPDGESPRVPC